MIRNMSKITALSPFPESILKIFAKHLNRTLIPPFIDWELVEKCEGITEELLGKSDDNDTTKDQEITQS